MAASMTPAIVRETEPPALAVIAERHMPNLDKLVAELERLKARPLDQMTADWAQELDSQARDWLDDWDQDTEPTRKSLYDAWSNFNKFSAKRREPAELIRRVCTGVGMKREEADGGIVGRFNAEQARIAAEKQRELDRIAREETRRQQQAEADAIAAQAAATNDPVLLEEAVRVEQATPVPLSTPAPPPLKASGSATSYQRIGLLPTAKAERGKALRAYLLWALRRPDDDLILEAIPELSPSGIDAQLRRGLTPDGLIIKQKPSNANRTARRR